MRTTATLAVTTALGLGLAACGPAVPTAAPLPGEPVTGEPQTTASGLQYYVLTEGTGAQPTVANTVEVDYAGYLLDGTKFDSSYDRGQPASFTVGGVIRGWQEGLALMKVGGKYKFVIPGNLGYGPEGSPAAGIGPDATLVFDVELHEVQ